MKGIPILVILLFLCSIGLSQSLVFHKNQHRQAIYNKGDHISFCLKGDRFKYTGRITGFNDSKVVIDGVEIHPDQISHLYVDDKTKICYSLRYKYEQVFTLLGAGYIILDVVNNGDIDSEVLAIGTALIGAGLMARLFISRRIKIDGKRRIDIIVLPTSEMGEESAPTG